MEKIRKTLMPVIPKYAPGDILEVNFGLMRQFTEVTGAEVFWEGTQAPVIKYYGQGGSFLQTDVVGRLERVTHD